MNESVGTNAGKFDGYDVEGHAVCLRPAAGKPISALAYAALDNLQPGELDIPSSRITNLDGTVEYNVADYASVTLGVCEIDRMYVDTCFLPDQYAIQWAWAGNGQLQSYDPITGEWTEWGQTIDPATGNVVGGYALAFKNDAVEPVIYFQRSGKLYKADPADPINTFQLIGATLPAAPSSYPCFAFDPSGRLLAGIASGSTVVEIDPTTGAATNIGALIDVRDGANLQAGPGDWYFDPNGDWFLMARDTRGALFGEACVDTVLWKIDPATLEAVRISNECSPISGTGAEWLAAGIALLSHSNGTLSQYNSGSGEWSAFPNSAPQAINDLSAQWIIPEPIKVFGFVDKDTPLEDQCEDCLYTMAQNEDTFVLECRPFTLAIPGTFGKCEADPNPFVSDPFSPVAGETTIRSDQVWREGCSDAGPTKWRTFYDEAGVASAEYLYGTLSTPTSLKPEGFTCFECGKVVVTTETIPHCDLNENKTVYRKEKSDGSVVWFDENGEIPEPDLFEIGECPDVNALLPVEEQTICFEEEAYIRQTKEQYVENAATGLPELQNYQIVYYNEAGVLFDSGILDPDQSVPAGEPSGWTLGDCVSPYVAFEVRQLCEKDDKKLLLVDSGGAFAEYSFADGSLLNIPSLQVPSAGSGADPDNFVLYALTQQDNLQTIDVNTKTLISEVPLFTNDGSPLGFSAAHFYDGVLYAADSGTGGWRLYTVDLITAEVSSFNGPWSGISGSGTSLAINPVDGKFYITGSSGRVYEVGSAALASGAATLVYDSPGNTANGATFDTDGILYLTGGPNTYAIDNLGTPAVSEELIIDSFPAGANSITFYRTQAQNPACFFRRYGVLQDGTWEYISDHYVSDFSVRNIAGAVDCCDACDGESSTSTGNAATAEDIGAEVESQATYKGPTAAEIAKAVLDEERNRISGRMETWWNNTNTQQLNVPAGTIGTLVSITEYGTGSVYWTIDGSTPSANTSGTSLMNVQYGNNINLRGIDLSLLRFNGTSTNSDYSVTYEVWT